MSTVTVINGDSRDVLKTLPDNSVDSVVCDPPYALVSIVKRFGKPGSVEAKSDGPSGVYKRASAGFMGQSWDTGETAFDPDFWREVLRVLKPGGHVLAFGAGRGVHHLATAIETAGFEIRDRVVEIIAADTHVCAFLNSLDHEQQEAFLRCIEESTFGGELAWVFGSGFPKSLNVSKAIDKAAGAQREIIRERYTAKRIKPGATVVAEGGYGKQDVIFTATDSAPATPEAARWEGWGSALKPALEPIVVARKPLSEGSIVGNVLKWGVGGLNIDGCRVEASAADPNVRTAAAANHLSENFGGGCDQREGRAHGTPDGRWPANVVLDGSNEVLAAFPHAPGQLRAVTGEERSHITKNAYGDFGTSRNGMDPRADGGSAARFFYSAKADAEDRLGSKHPTVKPVDLMQWLCRLVTPPGGTVLDPFAGSGSTGIAAMNEGFDCILIERKAEYVADINRRIAWARGEGRLTALELARDIEPEKAAGADLPLFSGDAA